MTRVLLLLLVNMLSLHEEEVFVNKLEFMPRGFVWMLISIVNQQPSIPTVIHYPISGQKKIRFGRV